MTRLPAGTPLFRPEVAAHRSRTVFGTVLAPPAGLVRYASMTAVFLVFVLVAIAAVGEYTRTVTVAGWLEPAGGMARVVGARPGVVATVSVVEGQAVHAGDTLALIAADRSSASFANIDEEVSATLKKAHSALTGQIDSELEIAAADISALESEVTAYLRSERSTAAQVEIVRQRLTLSEGEHRRTSDLLRQGFLSPVAAETSLDRLLGAKLAVEQALSHQEQEARVLQARRQALSDRPLKLRSRLADLQKELSNLDQRIAETDAAKGFLLRAPVNGRVSGLVAMAGDSVIAGSLLMTVVPEDSFLRAQILVPTRSAGFIRSNMKVLLRYDAYPYQKYGKFEGVIEGISEVAFSPSDQVQWPLKFDEPVFRVVVRLTDRPAQSRRNDIILRPGLTLHAEILLESRKIFQWVLNPLYT